MFIPDPDPADISKYENALAYNLCHDENMTADEMNADVQQHLNYHRHVMPEQNEHWYPVKRAMGAEKYSNLRYHLHEMSEQNKYEQWYELNWNNIWT